MTVTSILCISQLYNLPSINTAFVESGKTRVLSSTALSYITPKLKFKKGISEQMLASIAPAIRHVVSVPAPAPSPLILAETDFLKFTYKEFNYHGVIPPTTFL